jgi:hypothetical protein
MTTGCKFTKQECSALLMYDTAGIIAGATVGTAALIGIILAIVAFLVFGGAATYGIYSTWNSAPEVTIQNNPIYAESGNSGTNPLAKV